MITDRSDPPEVWLGRRDARRVAGQPAEPVRERRGDAPAALRAHQRPLPRDAGAAPGRRAGAMTLTSLPGSWHHFKLPQFMFDYIRALFIHHKNFSLTHFCWFVFG